MQSISDLLDRALAQIQASDSLAALDQLRIEYLGKSGKITALKQTLATLAGDEKKAFGQAWNNAKTKIEEAIEQGKTGLREHARPRGPALDVTLPGRRRFAGRVHPMTATAETMKSILMGLGFSYDDYPDIETEEYNFDALNTPAWHPARDLHDTFYTDGAHVMRTHTTAYQGRVMRASGGQIPIRAMTTGRCYRKDDIDASHYPIFQQLDAFAVGTKITMADLRWTLTELAKGLFGPEAKLRFRLAA